MNRVNWKKLAVCVGIPLLVGAVSSLLTKGEMESFSKLNQPALSPPGWLFPVVWTILYVLMGVASYLVDVSGAQEDVKGRSLLLYGVQLFFNFWWSLFFFKWHFFLFSFLWLLGLWFLILLNIKSFLRISKIAGRLLIPYLLWVTFAAYLNWGIFLLN